MNSRRQFLSTSAAAAVAVALNKTVNASANEAAADIPIVDTHQHLWDLSQVQPPWLSGAPKILSQTYGLAEYAKATEGLNVVQAVYMEVDVAPEDQVKEADTLIEICRSKKGPTVAAVMRWGRVEPALPAPSHGAHLGQGARQLVHTPGQGAPTQGAQHAQ